jgi:hypothetical protein
MTTRILNERFLGEQATPDAQLVLGEAATPGEIEETLVPDVRGDLTPSQIVAQRLNALLAKGGSRVLVGEGRIAGSRR